MAYSRAWTDTTPVSTDPASGAPTDMQHIRVDLRERLMTMFTMPDFTSDPLKISAISLGYNAAGFGGKVRLFDDGGLERWNAGVLGSANTDYRINDIVNNAVRLTINATTGIVTIGGLTCGVISSTGNGVITGNLNVSGSIQANANIIAATGLTVTTGGIHVAVGDVQLDQTLHVTGVITAIAGVVGNVTGNCSGSSGSCTGNAATATNVAASGITGSIVDGQITSLTANKLSGALPAISGANLTNLTGANVTGTVANATNSINATTAGTCTGNAATATNATNATNATTAASCSGNSATATTASNATNLGGVAAGSYALKSGSSALVVTGASVTAAAFYVV